VNGVPVSHYAGDFDTPMNVIANLAVARDGFAFNPGPNEATNFPADYQVDYIRVWKLTSDNEYKTSKFLGAKTTIAPLKYATLTFHAAHKTEISKKVRFVYDKKKLVQEVGFISMVPTKVPDGNVGAYQIDLNGINSADVNIQMIDAENNHYEPTLIETHRQVLFFPKKGTYQITIESGGHQTKFTLTI
jgi:hypothetical protein